ncbi:MAG: NAD(P)H-dependent oxidoreductase [Actinobacteria bacterium]|jgi:chromate reductase|nr:NAD(P)H-dependent oxidoreductase [Actinomycetota bacterium]
MSNIKLLGLSGSLRSGSYNTSVLRNVKSLLPQEIELEIYQDLGKLPLYSEDLDGVDLHPEARRLRNAIAESDGVLISSPEHNFSLSAALKNALDWSSRPYGSHPFIGKPTGILGASGGILGTIRAQLHTREILHALEADLVTRPEVLITQAGLKFDTDGRLVDDSAKALILQLIDNLTAKIENVRKNLEVESLAS